MSKLLKKLTIGVLSLCCVGLIGFGVGCGKKSSESTESQESVAIILSNEVLSMDVHTSATISIESGATGKQTWTSLSPEIATVDENGVVTAIAEGQCEIRVSNENGSASCFVIVSNSYTAPTIELNDVEIQMAKDGTYVLAPVLKYRGEDRTADAQLHFNVADVEDESVISVQAQGNTALITAREYGTAECVIYAEFVGVEVSARVTVTVKEFGVVFDATNLTPVKGGYELTLSTYDMDGYWVNLTPNVNVQAGETFVKNAEISYVSDDSSIVAVENGTLSAKGFGETTVTGSYNGNSFTIAVEVIRPKKEVAVKNRQVEVGRLRDLNFAENLTGTLVAATIDGVSVGEAIVDGKLQLSKSKLETLSASSYGKDVALQVVTDKIEYSTTLDLYTLVIRSEEDYRNIGAMSKAACKDSETLYGGYFILGNDITVTGGVNEFINRGAQSLKGDGSDGFCGVFDGNGYTIDGISRTGSTGNAFITALHRDGVLQNLGFTNVKYAATGGSFLVQFGTGTVRDVYIQYAEISASGLYCATVMQGATMERVFIDASKTVVSGTGNLFNILAYGKESVKVIADSFVVVMPEAYEKDPTVIKINSSDNANTLLGKTAFISYDALKMSNQFAEIQKWNVDIWHADLDTGVVTFGVPSVDKEEIVISETVNLQTRQRIELDVHNDGSLNAAKMVEFDIPATEEIVSVNGQDVYFNSVYTDYFGYNYGEQTVEVITKTQEGAYKQYNIPVLLVTKIIKTVEDYNAWGTISKAANYGGYFELGNDIRQSGGIAMNIWNTNSYWKDPSGYIGFKGTLDGCGYVIDGLKMTVNGIFGGFVGTMTKTGTLKNIGFTNIDASAITDNTAFLGTTTYGNLENVYIHYAALPSVADKLRTVTPTAYTGVTVEFTAKNVLIDASDVTHVAGTTNFKLMPDTNYDNGFYGITANGATAISDYNGKDAAYVFTSKASAAAAIADWDDAADSLWQVDESAGTISFGAKK